MNNVVVTDKATGASGKALYVMPLGGLGEVGMNLMLYEYDGQILVVDCGMTFPTHETPGVDVIIPDVQFLIENRDKVVGIVLTHGHEDHIGALPHIWPQVGGNIYGTSMTLGMVEHRMREHQLHNKVTLVTVGYRQPFQLGPFNICFMHVTHSIIEAAALAITTPLGTVIHTGDFNIDHTPKSGMPTDLFRFAQYGEKGVLALLSDSTNIATEGSSRSERIVEGALSGVLEAATGMVLVTTFSSNLNRVQQVVEVAARHGRKVAISGRSMLTNVQVAKNLNLLDFPIGSLIDLKTIGDYPRDRVLILSTGSQGEQESSLVRIANDGHKDVALQAGDTVIFSSRFIPGNEQAIWSLINALYRKGVHVIHDKSVRDIHVSGHAPRDDLKTMLALTKPRFFMPIHGEMRHLHLHRQLAMEMGIPEARTCVATNGDRVAFDGETVHIVGSVPYGRVFVDGKGVGDVGDVVLRDRKHLAEDGMAVVILLVDKETGTLLERPELLTRGVVYEDESQDLLEEARIAVQTAIELGPKGLDFGDDEEVGINDLALRGLRRFFKKKLGRRPMVLPLVVEM